jgi:predicted DNA-binding transcriptional regulator AlpA
MATHEIDNAERDTILAALRTYQEAGYGDPNNRPDRIQDIACPTIDDTSLDDDAIDRLCERLNTEGDTSDVQIIRWPDLQVKLGGRSLTSVTRAEKAGDFPKRVQIGQHVGWIEREVDEYILNLPRGPKPTPDISDRLRAD